MEDGVYIQSRQKADLVNVAHFRAKTTRILMKELLFADDSALVVHTAEEMQKIVVAFSDMSKSLARRLISRRPRCCTNPTLLEPGRRISWLMETR